MTVAELRQLLEAAGARPIKDRSQHFLLDETVVDGMIAAAAVGKGDQVVEIGPGPGILTAKLLSAGADVVALELDKKMCQIIVERFGSALHLIEGDALAISNTEIEAKFFGGVQSPYKVVANVPYAITSPLLKKFLLEAPKPVSITFLVQREVAERITAKPGEMGSLAVLVQTYSMPKIIRRVLAGAFFPPPKVESAILHLELRTAEQLQEFFGDVDPDRYFMLVQSAFAESRKQIKNTLRKFFPTDDALASAAERARVKISARPAEFSIDQWRKLSL